MTIVLFPPTRLWNNTETLPQEVQSCLVLSCSDVDSLGVTNLRMMQWRIHIKCTALFGEALWLNVGLSSTEKQLPLSVSM
jgi:hypothetical protein